MSEISPSDDVLDPQSLGGLTERAAWSVVFLGVLIIGVNFAGGWTQDPIAVLVSPVLIVMGIAGMVWTWNAPATSMGRIRLGGFLISAFAALTPAAIETHARHWFSTDSAALNQLAGEALVRGHNPYTASMAAVDLLLKNPARFYTYLASGGHVTHISYPPGSFLLVAPFQALGFHHATADWVDLAAWGIAVLAIYLMLPGRIRFLAPMLLLFAGFTGAFTSGGTDALFLPFLVVAVWRWDDLGSGRTVGWHRWVGPVALGLACSIKQGPWFFVPFLVAGTAIEARAAGRSWIRLAASYLGATIGVFAVVNLPFLVADPGAWFDGTTLPFRLPLVADGSGVVALALHGLTGGAVMPWLTMAGLLMVVALLVAFVLWYPATKRIWLFALPLALGLPGRSLASYFVNYFPIAIVAAVCVHAAPSSGLPVPRRSLRVLAVAAPLTACLVAITAGLTTSPLEINVARVKTTDHARAFRRVTITVHNTSSRRLAPRFFVDTNGGHPDGYWQTTPSSGSWPIPAGATSTLILTPRGYASTPDPGHYWIVDAYTTGPEALSTSRLMKWPDDGHDRRS